MNDEQQSTIDPKSTEMQPTIAPPTVAAPYLKPQSSWPTVVGAIGIVYASLGFLGSACGLITIAFLPKITEWMQSMGMPASIIEDMEDSMPSLAWTVIGSILGIAIILMLFIGSIKLLKRYSSGAKLCKLWAWISIPWVLASTAINFSIQTQAAQSTPFASQISAAIGMGFGLIFALALPIFMTIWFARGKIRQEVASWNE